MALLSQLNLLEARGLILLAQIQPEVQYLFRHALVQEAAYQSLVKIDRRRLHRAVGEALERLYAGPAAPGLAPVLAQHFAEAGDAARALHYYTLAGRAAAEMYAHAEAIHHFGRALAIAQASAPGGDPAVIVDLYLRRGHAFELNAQDAEALRNYEALGAWAAAHGQRAAQLAGLNARATIYVKPSVEMNLPLGYSLSQQALALARALGNPAAEAKARWNLLQYHLVAGHLKEAIAQGEQALAIARAEGLREQTAYVLTDLVKVYYQAENAGRSREALAEARQLWRELGLTNMLADNLATTSMLHTMSGNYAEALAVSAEAARLSRTIANRWNEAYAHYLVDLVHFDRGEIAQAIAVAETALRLSEQAGFSEGVNQAYFDLALIYSYLGALTRALECAQTARARVQVLPGAIESAPQMEGLLALVYAENGRLAEAEAALNAAPVSRDPEALRQQFPMTQVLFARVQGELALHRGEPERTRSEAAHISESLRQIGIRLFLADALLLEARALRALGRAAPARAVLETARAEAEAIGSRRLLWLILAELAALATDDGDETAAQALRGQAVDLIDYIAEHIGAADLRAGFLNRPDVQAVLRQPEGRTPPGP